jgi:hypothetical protein
VVIRLEPIDFITPKDDNPFESFLARLKEHADEIAADESSEERTSSSKVATKGEVNSLNERKQNKQKDEAASASTTVASVRPYDAGHKAKYSSESRGKPPNESPFGKGFDDFFKDGKSFWPRSPLRERSDKLVEPGGGTAGDYDADPTRILPQDEELQSLFSQMRSPFPAGWSVSQQQREKSRKVARKRGIDRTNRKRPVRSFW